MAVKLFYSYSHKDENHRVRLGTSLSVLEREGLIEEWHDRKIMPGQNWEEILDENLETADIVVLLVSSDFLASDYCYEKEMKRALERHSKGETTVIPVIVRPCEWDRTPLADLQALPKDTRPITKWSNRDEAWLYVARGIRTVVEEANKVAKTRPSVSATPRYLTLAKNRRSGNIPGLSPEASLILRHLVLEVGLHNLIDAPELTKAVDLTPVEVNDSVDELDELGLAHYLRETVGPGYDYNFNDVEPRALAWTYVEPDLLGFDPEDDMANVARCAVTHSEADTNTLETDTSLPPERINIAALSLNALNVLDLVQVMGADPYDFLFVVGNRRTRQWLKERT